VKIGACGAFKPVVAIATSMKRRAICVVFVFKISIIGMIETAKIQK
jgi:hypothetical protein